MKSTVISSLSSNLQGSTTLDLVASALALDHDAALRRISSASTTVNQKTRATTHTVGRRRIQLIAVVHSLESLHVAQGISALRKRTNRDLALATGVVAARSWLARAGTGGVNVGTIIASAREVVTTLGVGVRTTSGRVQGGCKKKPLIHNFKGYSDNLPNTISLSPMGEGWASSKLLSAKAANKKDSKTKNLISIGKMNLYQTKVCVLALTQFESSLAHQPFSDRITTGQGPRSTVTFELFIYTHTQTLKY